MVTYTAPANGWFKLSAKSPSGTTGQAFGLHNLGNQFIVNGTTGVGNTTYYINIPVKKSDVVKLTLHTTGSNALYFIYAEGEV